MNNLKTTEQNHSDNLSIRDLSTHQKHNSTSKLIQNNNDTSNLIQKDNALVKPMSYSLTGKTNLLDSKQDLFHNDILTDNTLHHLNDTTNGLISPETSDMDSISDNTINSMEIQLNATASTLKLDNVEYIVNMDVEEPKQFWKSKLEGFEYQSFPLLTDSLNRTSNKRISRHVSVDMNKMKQLTKDLQITMGTVIHTAWSLLLYNYSRNEKVVFGNVISGRDSGMEGIER
ncbi:hypothetical protein BC833DRAFT_654293 [Globomyces pollinis-pini]|nr:hypothetical protein BC833DRAFT_654293 [Globomyces pollinis-pini]